MKLALKLALALLLGIGVVLALYALQTFQRETDLFHSDMQRDNRFIGQALANALREVRQRSGEAAAVSALLSADRTRNHVQLRWVWLDAPPGSPAAPQIPAGQLQALRRNQPTDFFERREPEPGDLLIYFPIVIEGDRVAALEVRESLDEEQLYTSQTLLRTATVAAVMILVSGAVALLLGLWFVGRPLRLLTDRMRRVAEGDLASHVQLRQHDELGQLADEFNQMCDRLAAANARATAATAARLLALQQLRHADRLTTVGQLTSGVAHELGTPLNVVWARAKMIAKRDVVGDEAADSARVIAEQSVRMIGIIRQLLDFARPRPPRREQVDLSQVVKCTAALMAPVASRPNVKLATQGTDRAWPALADADQIQQVLSNLVLNAVQAMPHGGPVTISVDQRRARPPADHGGPEADYLCVSVSDAGEGITPENLQRVFEPFFTTKEVGAGTGLGLSVSLGIVREHGGWIDVESQPGQGSCFRVYLPAETS